MRPDHWFLTKSERGNPATAQDDRHPGEQAWSTGNRVTVLVHGAEYFRQLTEAVERLEAGDLLLFVDWRGDPDERLLPDRDLTVSDLFSDAVRRGVDVRGLIWRSHWDKLAFSAEENRRLGDRINAAGGCAVLDMRVRNGGSHHQKFVVLRHPGRPERDVAFVGGIDLCHSRRDDERHLGDPQTQPMADVYGRRPPWHDVQLRIEGPAVADVETVFRERWDDPHTLTRNPAQWVVDRARELSRTDMSPLPAPLAPPPPAGDQPVQLLRTYPRRSGGYPFAPRGERSVARGLLKAIENARDYIFIEDQYLWSKDIGRRIAAALRRNPSVQLIAVVPHHPDQDGALALPPNIVGRQVALHSLAQFRDRVAVYGIENEDGTPIYVHAKLCIVDDQWLSVGSANMNRRSWTHDSELTAAVVDPHLARDLRLRLAREHLGTDVGEPDVRTMCAAFHSSAVALQDWYDGGRKGTRPAGQLRPLHNPPLPLHTRAWSTVLYRTVYDPDGRPLGLRLRNGY